MHDPDFDHVLRPVEFDEAISDKFFVALTVSDDTFHVTVVRVGQTVKVCASVALYTYSARFRDANGRTLPSPRYWCRVVDDHWTATRRTLCDTFTVFLSG